MKNANNALLRTSHKVRRPENADVRHKMKRIGPSIVGMTIAAALTGLAGGFWAVGWKWAICVLLYPGMLLGWAFVFGDNISSLDEVTGTITMISLVTNTIGGFILGALVGAVVRMVRKPKIRGEQGGPGYPPQGVGSPDP